MSDRIEKATARRDFLAKLVMVDEVYLPIFVRLDEDLRLLVAMDASDPVAAARARAQRRAA